MNKTTIKQLAKLLRGHEDLAGRIVAASEHAVELNCQVECLRALGDDRVDELADLRASIGKAVFQIDTASQVLLRELMIAISKEIVNGNPN